MAEAGKWHWKTRSDSPCRVCEGMAGIHDTVPERPHPNCVCEIVGIPGHNETECAQWDWSVKDSNFMSRGANEPRKVTLEGVMTCCDGRRFEFTLDFEWDADKEKEGASEALRRLDEKAHWIVQNHCIGFV
jgi:hypothetical protein